MAVSAMVLGGIVFVAIYRVRRELQGRIEEREHKVSAEVRKMYETTFLGYTLDERGQPVPKPPEV